MFMDCYIFCDFCFSVAAHRLLLILSGFIDCRWLLVIFINSYGFVFKKCNCCNGLSKTYTIFKDLHICVLKKDVIDFAWIVIDLKTTNCIDVHNVHALSYICLHVFDFHRL